MSTKNLIYHAYDASSLPVDGVDVTLECFDSAGGRSVFYGTSHLLAPYTGTTAADGSVTINNVPANADTDDPYSYYLFTARGVLELTAGGGQGYFDQFYVVVPHSGSSPIDISTIKRDAPPTPGGATPLHDQTSHQGDIWPDATDQVAGASTLQIAQQSSAGVSAPPAGSRKIFVRDSDNHLALMKSDSSVIDLESAGSGLSGGTPALTLSTSNSAGVAATGIRTDATIAAFDATAPTTETFGQSAAAGSAGTAARRDHAHGVPTSTAGPDANVTVDSAGAAGTSNTAARSGHGHQVVTTAGPGADDTIDAAGAAGATGAVARAGHGHKLTTYASTPAAVTSAGAIGTSGTAPSRGDHAHPHEAAHTAHDTIWDAKGDLAAGTGADTAAKLTVGADDTILMADAAQSTGLKWVASGTPSTQAFGDSATVGTADTFTRGDHKHAMPSATTTSSGLQMSTARLLGRTTASTGAIEEISAGATLALSAGSLDLAADGHGAASHTDITRSIWLTASHQAGNAGDGGSLTLVGTAFPQKVPVWALADAATQGFVETFGMPADAKAATAITATIFWTPGSTDGTAHTVRWSFEAIVRNAGDTIDFAGTTTTFTGSSATRTAKVVVAEAAQTILSSTSAGDFVRLNLRRIGADAADTYVGVVNVHAIRIDYTATG